MNNSSTVISNQMHGFDNGSTIFFKKGRCSVLPSIRLTPNIRKNFAYLFGISPLKAYTEHLTCFFLKYLEAQQVWASKNITNKPENVKKT